MLKFFEKFNETLQENWWNFKEHYLVKFRKYWWNLEKNLEKISKKIGKVLCENFGEILRKMRWNFEKNLMKSCYRGVIFCHATIQRLTLWICDQRSPERKTWPPRLPHSAILWSRGCQNSSYCVPKYR